MKKFKSLKIVLIVFLSLIIICLSATFIYVTITISSVRDMDISLNQSDRLYTKILNSQGENTAYSNNLKNNYISIEDIPEYTKNAFLSIEDKKFYEHKGLNYKRMAKAAYNNILSGKYKEGASTITQQLVKNKFLTSDKTISRKIKEAYLSKKLENNETKDKILETYINTIYFGNGAYGIGNATKVFFNKSVNELTLSESAILAGCIKSPSKYSPINNKENCINRRNLVLEEMYKDKHISLEEYNEAISNEIFEEDFNLEYIKSSMDLYSQYVVDEACEILGIDEYDLINGGYKIYTYQDNGIQNNLDEKINNEIYYHKNQYGNIADSLSIIIDNKTHGVSAISGKSEYNLLNVNRQPGSLIKPIMVYGPALEEGLINCKTQILDEKTNFDGYEPKNVSNKYYGYVSVEDAVAKSLNIPTVKIAQELGIEKCKDYAEKCGINFNENNDSGYALTLGGFYEGVSLKEITDSYSPFINNGNYIKSAFVKKITNINNATLYDRVLTESHIYNDDTCYLMTNILDYSVNNGTSKKLSNLDFDIAGKTGTVAYPNTNYNTDAYSLAYTSEHTMSVWLGNYSMEKEYNLEGSNNGGTYATEIIRDTLKDIYKIDKPEKFSIPQSVSEYIIDEKSLIDNHEVKLGNNVPDRYQIKAYFSNRYPPLETSNIFNEICPFDFNIIENKNSITITFDALDYLDYKIYRKDNFSEKEIARIKNYNGYFEYIDKDISFNQDYYYFIVAESNYSNNNYKTNSKTINIKKEYKKLINNTSDDFSWLFG